MPWGSVVRVKVCNNLELPRRYASTIIAIPVRMNWSTTWFSWPHQLLVLWLLFLAPDAALARQANNEVTPEVQQLFVRAKVAEQHGDATTAIEEYRAIIKLAPHLAPAYNNLGLLYLKDHDYTHAVEVLKCALELDPNMPTASGMLGMTYFQLGVNEKAEPLLRQALSSNPTDGNVEMTLALILVDLKKYEEAASYLNNFLNRNPKSAEGWYLLRKTYLQMSEDARAKINEIDPDSVVAHEMAGEIDENMLDYSAAMAEYQKAIDKAPRQPGTHMAMGNVYWRIGKWESAQGEFKAELANNQNNCTAHWKLADAMLEANDSSEDALSELNRSIDLCPTLMQARVDRARALVRLSKQSDALPDLLMAEKDNPAEPSIHFLLASVYRAQGKTAEVQQEMRTFEQLRGHSTRDMLTR
jgi:tetratricopeptide (TPR) repeat protein